MPSTQSIFDPSALGGAISARDLTVRGVGGSISAPSLFVQPPKPLGTPDLFVGAALRPEDSMPGGVISTRGLSSRMAVGPVSATSIVTQPSESIFGHAVAARAVLGPSSGRSITLDPPKPFSGSELFPTGTIRSDQSVVGGVISARDLTVGAVGGSDSATSLIVQPQRARGTLELFSGGATIRPERSVLHGVINAGQLSSRMFVGPVSATSIVTQPSESIFGYDVTARAVLGPSSGGSIVMDSAGRVADGDVLHFSGSLGSVRASAPTPPAAQPLGRLSVVPVEAPDLPLTPASAPPLVVPPSDEVFATMQGECRVPLAQRWPAVERALDAAHDSILRGDTESLAQAALACRRALNALADAVYPARRGMVRDRAGNARPAGRHEWKNRLMLFLEGNVSSRSTLQHDLRELEVLAQALRSFFQRLDAGTHGYPSAAELRRLYVLTWVAVAEVLRHAD